jgi:hypothetical protein
MGRDFAARMLINHLTWIDFQGNNLVSWTSSFLVAVQLAIYRWQWRKDTYQYSPEQITIFILNTNGMPRMKFQSAERLIRRYKEEISVYRQLKDKSFHGEYLSQGKLNLEEHHSRGDYLSFTLQNLIDNGLFELHPRLKEPSMQIRWVLTVKDRRAEFEKGPQSCTVEELFTATKLAITCLPRSRQMQAALAVAMLTIVPRAGIDKILLDFMAMTLIGTVSG